MATNDASDDRQMETVDKTVPDIKSEKDEDDEYETQLVVVDLSGITDPNYLKNCPSKCKIIGLETDTPVLQLGHYVFSGEYHDTIGTDMLFKKTYVDSPGRSGDRNSQDADGETQLKLEYQGCTHKRLKMKRAFLTPKESDAETDSKNDK